MTSGIHISISAEPVFHIGGFVVTNSMIASVIVSALLVLFALSISSSFQSTGKPTRFQALAEFIVESIHNLVTGVVGEGKKALVFGPIIFSFFMFILLNNWIGLLPGVGTVGLTKLEEVHEVQAAEELDNASSKENAEEPLNEEPSTVKTEEVFIPYLRAATADLNTTLALALISIGLVQFFGLSYQHAGYLKKFFNVSTPINFFVGILEFVSEISKIISFAFRLFGNIFAGEVLLVVMMYLTKVIIPMPFYAMEIFVGFIQALVFSMLSLVFFNMATISHGEEH